MSTFRLPILGHATMPDASGDVWYDNFANHATNDTFKLGCWVFDDETDKNGIYGLFHVPENYNSAGTTNLVVVWTGATADPGANDDVTWDFDYRAISGSDTESLDQAGFVESVTAADQNCPSAAFERIVTEISLTAGNFAAEDTVEFYFCRDGANETNQYAEEALLFELLFEYTD